MHRLVNIGIYLHIRNNSQILKRAEERANKEGWMDADELEKELEGIF